MVFLKGLCQSEIQHFYFSITCQFDIRRLQVSMYDTLLVGSFECFTDVPGNIESFFNWNCTASNPLRERWAFHQFQYEEARHIGFLDVVDRGDIRMVQ